MTSTADRPEKQKRRSFLTPGWIMMGAFVLIFMYFAFTALAPWQLGKNERRTEFNERLRVAVDQDPVPIAELIGNDGKGVGVGKEWARVSMQGYFLPSKEVLLRNRPVASAPAYQMLTPFKTSDGLTILVNRGWVPAEAHTGPGLPPIAEAPSTPQNLTGYIRMGEGVTDHGVQNTDGRFQTTSVNSAEIAQVMELSSDGPVAEDYVQLDEETVDNLRQQATNETDVPHVIPLPQLESGPYLSYGIQWIAFGIIAPIGLAWFVWSEIRERRREREEASQLAATASPTRNVLSGAAPSAQSQRASEEQSSKHAAATPQARSATVEDTSQPASEDRLADRYGKSRPSRGFGVRKNDQAERF